MYASTTQTRPENSRTMYDTSERDNKYNVNTNLHCVSKTSHLTQNYNSIRPLPIVKIISPLESILNFQQNLHNIFLHTLIVLLHYLGNLKFTKCFGVLLYGTRYWIF